MRTHIYECFKLTFDFIVMMMISQYIFLIPPMQKKEHHVMNPQFLFVLCTYIPAMIVCWVSGTEAGSTIIITAMLVYCHLTADKRKRKVFQIGFQGKDGK